jgi:deoxyadenosine/deoxycytidine kinase
MGRIIAIVGNAGVGKTTLARRLAEHRGMAQALEGHEERPFQQACQTDPHRFAFANQVDYLLYRAEQETNLRALPHEAVVDGGLDLDFHGFTHLFREKGFLTATEFAVCERLYHRLRAHLPPPEVIVHLRAPLSVVERRHAARARPFEIAGLQDLPLLERWIESWLAVETQSKILRLDAGRDDPTYRTELLFLDEALGPPA